MSDDIEARSPLKSVEEINSDPKQYNYYRSIFNKYDKDGDGSIDIAELKYMIKDHVNYDNDIPKHVVDQILGMSDKNHDGKISFDEFVSMINNPKLKKLFGKYVTKYIQFLLPRKGHDETDLQYEDQYSCCPPALGMIIISIVEVLLFVVDECLEPGSKNYGNGPTAKWLLFDPTKKIEMWRYLTYMFVHIGNLHLVVNLATQLLLGIPLEMVHGYKRVLSIYFLGVISGSLVTAVTDQKTRLAGASGGVYSIITAHIATIALNWEDMTFPAVQLIIFALIICVDGGTSIYNRYFLDVNEHIGYAAHIAGAVTGILVGVNVLINLNVTKTEKCSTRVCLVVFIAAIIILIGFNIKISMEMT